MRVPETTVDEHHRPMAREHNVRSSGEVLAVEAEPVAEAVNQGTDELLRFGIPGAYGRHNGAPLLPRYGVGHSSNSMMSWDSGMEVE